MAVKTRKALITSKMVGNSDDAAYRAILSAFQQSALDRIGDGPVFTTDADGLFDVYIGAFPPRKRQHHTCSACRKFMENYGGLVTIAVDGSVEPVFWPASADWMGDYAVPIAALRARVQKSKVSGVFLSKDAAWGQAITGTWCHFAVALPRVLPRRSQILTPGQEMAERREDYANVSRALSEWSIDVLNAAVRLLDSDALFRSEKLLGAATWLRDLAVARKENKRAAAALLWHAIGTAPAGFCHPRSGMLGTLLDDLASGADFEGVSRRFSEKMHPLRYQRPQAPPASGAIAQAEKLVETLGLRRSFERRFAHPDDVLEWLWRPRAVDEKPLAEGMFSHLKPKGERPVDVSVPETSVSWAVFARDVLPRVNDLRVYVPGHASFVTLVTAEYEDAPPIFQWDRDEARNPVSWYVWHGGSMASQYGLTSGYAKVVGLCEPPHQWLGAKSSHFPNGVLVLIDGAKETRNSGNALFPETLKSDLHGVRSVVEAHSRSQRMIDHGDHAGGTGLFISAKDAGVRLRVTLDGVTTHYTIDRLE